MRVAEKITLTNDQMQKLNEYARGRRVPVRVCERAWPQSWSLIGAPYEWVAVENIGQNPPGILTSIWKWLAPDGPYARPDTTAPGEGYWANLSASGTLTIPGGAAPSRAQLVRRDRVRRAPCARSPPP